MAQTLVEVVWLDGLKELARMLGPKFQKACLARKQRANLGVGHCETRK